MSGERPTQTEAVSGPWVAEDRVCEDAEERGLAVIALVPEVHRNGFDTPTRGMVAWVHSGLGACDTDEQAIATARLISAAPDLLEALKFAHDYLAGNGWEGDSRMNPIIDALDKAEGIKSDD